MQRLKSRVSRATTGRHGKAVIFGCLLVVALFRFPTATLRLSFELLFEVATVLALAFVIYEENRWVAGFLLLACFSSFFPFYDRASYLAFRAVFTGVLWYWLVIRYGDTATIMDAMCIIALGNLFIMAAQSLSIPTILVGSSEVTGYMANRNETSALLAFCLPAFFRHKWWMALPLIFAGLVMAKSTGGVVAVAVGLIVWAFLSRTKRLGFVVSVLCVAGVALYLALIDAPGASVRLTTWIQGLELWTNHWAIGSGIGHWKYVFMLPEFMTPDKKFMLTAHNEPLQTLFELGIIFPVLLAGYLVNMVRRYRRFALVPATAIIIILVNSLVNFPFHIAVTAMIAVTWMAVYQIETRPCL